MTETSDTTRRPGDEPVPEGRRTTPGPRSVAPGTDARDGRPASPAGAGTHGPDTGGEPGRALSGPGDGSPPHAAHPGSAGAHRTGDRADAAGLLPHDDGDRFAARLQHAVAGFVDGPRDAVEEADRVLEELTARLADAVTERRRTLRRSWRAAEAGEGAAATDTEQLRLALRDYRELAERLLRV
ncbi:hypothetical protein GCM10019016_030580 [Streptomyces prasinosporus]|uniref:Uncharacterized protein n=1 Tax=Streptomyces prasinosporus TaxID=68256 RepID=A0ABP6TNC0_9ACTN